MRLPALLVVGSALLLAPAFASRTALAAEPTAAPTTPPPAAADLAREHYERGLAKYNLAEFDAAIVEFKQSYELSKAPRLLFNIAQAYRLKKDYASALYFYNTYLRADPNPPNLDDVEAQDRRDEARARRGAQERGGKAVRRRAAAAARRTSTGGRRSARSRSPARRSPRSVWRRVPSVAACSGWPRRMRRRSATSCRTGWRGPAPIRRPTTKAAAPTPRAIVLLSVGGALVVAGGITLIAAMRR